MFVQIENKPLMFLRLAVGGKDLMDVAGPDAMHSVQVVRACMRTSRSSTMLVCCWTLGTTRTQVLMWDSGPRTGRASSVLWDSVRAVVTRTRCILVATSCSRGCVRRTFDWTSPVVDRCLSAFPLRCAVAFPPWPARHHLPHCCRDCNVLKKSHGFGTATICGPT